MNSAGNLFKKAFDTKKSGKVNMNKTIQYEVDDNVFEGEYGHNDIDHDKFVDQVFSH